MDQVDKQQAVWWRELTPPSFPILEGDLETDTLIIGAGITGLTAALRLTEAGRRVVVIDAHKVGGGTTGSTTAHLTTQPDAQYSKVTKSFGKEGAQRVRASLEAALDHIEATTRRYGIDCGFRRTPGYLYSETEEGLEELQEELEAAQQAGMAVMWRETAPLPFPTRGALEVARQGSFQPLHYLYGLAEQAVAGGARLFEHTPAVAIDEGEPCTVTTPRGTVRAPTIVYATHLPLGRNLLQTRAAPYRSYVVELTLEGAAPQGLFWDLAEPYHYTNEVAANRLIIGGADHKTGEHDDERESYRVLERYAHERYPGAQVTRRWSSQYYNPADGLPFIGLSPQSSHIYLGTGYGGDGLSFGTLAGMMLSDALLGVDNPYADLYSPGRVKPLAAAKEFVGENVDVAARLLFDRISPDADGVGEIAPGEGAVVKHGGQQLAVYRDDTGALHTLSPVCTHLGCIVHWNHAEGSWDCPCHGGRYAATGEVICGPPLRGLERKT